MMDRDIELGRTNSVSPQTTKNGSVITIHDEDNNIRDEEKIEEGEEVSPVESKAMANSKQQVKNDDEDDDDEENKPLGFCRFIVSHHGLAFGMFIYFSYPPMLT